VLEAHVITIFPELFVSFLGCSFVKKAQDVKALSVRLHDLRDFTRDAHRSVDDVPFGGGPGMVLTPEPLFTAVEHIREDVDVDRVVLMTPQGSLLTQAMVEKLSQDEKMIIVCGRYEGVDERVRQHLVTDEISIGDYVLAGGELASMVLLEAITRVLPGVVGCPDSTFDESHSFAMLEYPQYTRPARFRGWKVPKVVLSGDHGRIKRWRARRSLSRTLTRRRDLVARWQDESILSEVTERLKQALEEE